MFKALMGGGRSSDARSTTSSSSKSRRKSDSKSSHSRKSSRGDDRDRGLGDLSAYEPSATGSKRGTSSVAGDSVASTYVTAEPEEIDTYPSIVERTPKRKDSDRENTRSRRHDRDRSESRDRDKRKSRRSTGDGDDDWERERDRRERRRTQSGDHNMLPVSKSMPSSAPGAQFAADIAAPGFSQFPMQYDNSMAPEFSPGHVSSPSPYDPHVQQQFPGQFPSETAKPFLPHNPAGAAADYYGDQGQSVAEQPGVRPQKPLVNSQEHLMAASPSANPPPEPSSLGQVGAAAAYFHDAEPVQSQGKPSSGSSSKPPKPGKPGKPGRLSKPSKPSKPSSSSAIPAAAAAAGAATYGIGNAMMSHEESQYSSTSAYQSHSYSQPAVPSTSKPPHSYGIGTGIGTGIGVAAAGAAAGYMLGHHDHPESTGKPSQYNIQNYEQSSQSGVPPYASGSNNAIMAAGGAGYAAHVAHAAHRPGYYPGSLTMNHRHRGPLSKFVDFWRDPEGVGRFEDYTETIGVCKYCFDPHTTSVDAPRKHHYHGRRHSADRYSSSSNSRVNKLSRYHSSEDERGRRKKSKKSSSWLPGMLAGYAAKSIFAGKDFDDSYSVRSGQPSGDRTSSHNDTMSYTSRGVVRRSDRNSSREYYYNDKKSQRNRSRSRSSSRSGRHSSFVKEAALGAAVGGAALAISKSHQRDRSRSPSRVQRRKESSSSSSFVDVSRPAAKSVGGFTSFFTSSSENRRKTRSKRAKSFFSFRSSSSSSLDNDLAFGDGFTKKSSKDKKTEKKKGKKGEDVDAALLGLGATAAALAASHSHGRSRSTGQILTAREARSRHSNNASSVNEDDEWVDAESEDHSSSSISSALAFGASSADSSSDSGSGRWGWGWGKKKQKKDKKSSVADAALAAGAGALGGAALASVARRRDSRPSSSAGSLQHVYPVPTSDPSRFGVAKMSPSVLSNDQTPLVRPGPIPLQQPQPITPVSQAVYSTQGRLPGSIPAYSAPAAVPPIFANEYDRYGPQYQGSRDAAWRPEDASYVEHRQPHRSNSSPVFPIQESSVSTPKRRSTIKDQASVSFNLTEEQAERERRLSLSRRETEPRDDFRDEPVQLVDREEELARQESERRERDRERRRKDREDEKRRIDSEKEKDSSKWVEAAAIGAIGVAAASSMMSHKKDGELASEASSKRRDARERRRAERRAESSIVSKSDVVEPVEVKQTPVDNTDYRDTSSPQRSPRPAQVYDDYAEFFAPEELRHSTVEHSGRRGSGDSNDKPEIVEVVPASEREKEEAKDEPTDLPQFGPEPYEDRDHLPWPVPRLNFIDPTPPHSINGSALGISSPIVGPQESRDETREVAREEPRSEPRPEPHVARGEEEAKPRERPTTGSRVSWGPHSTHEYEVPSSSEPEFSPTPEDFQDISIDFPEKEKEKSKGAGKADFGDDIEFAATVAAATEAAGFDPSFVVDDPKYHKRTSPPGSEDEGTFSHTSRWNAERDQSHGFVEGEIESPERPKSRDVDTSKHIIDQDPFYAEPESFTKDNGKSSSKRREGSSIAGEATEKLNGKHARSSSPENDVLSMPGGFDSFDTSREIDARDDTRSVFSAPPVGESERKSKSKKSRSGDDLDLSRDLPGELSRDLPRDTASPTLEDAEVDDKEKKRRRRRSKQDSDTFSIDDDARSAITSIEDIEKSERRKHRSRSSRDFDDTVSISSSPAKFDDAKAPRTPSEDDEKSERRKHRRSKPDSDTFSVDDDARSTVTSIEDGDKSERRKHRRSKRDSDTFSVDDDARSAITSIDDLDKSERRKHRSRSSRDFDDTASISSSPAKFDEIGEKRRSKDDKEKDKGPPGGLFRSLFGSRASEPTQSRSSHRSSSLDKRPSREAMSEAGVDDEGRRRKKKHRSSSGGDSLVDYGSDKESVRSSRSEANLEEYRSSRQKKEERRRHKYEDIVDSGRRRESEKDAKPSDYNEDSDKSFLGDRPELPAAAERDQSGASGFEDSAEKGVAIAAGLGLGEEILHQLSRSRSTSPPAAEKALDLAPRSHSRPSSPEIVRDRDESPRGRRPSLARSVTESPTAVPLHFRRPPTSPGLSRAVPVSGSPTAATVSPGSPTQPRHRRLNSVEFRNSREIRPLWLVERHGAAKGETAEADEPLPSLPSSKTSSRAPSIEDLRALNDEDAIQSWDAVDFNQSLSEKRRPAGLTISTERANEEGEADLLDSQQVTPTAAGYGADAASAKKERLSYEFHSPSELLQDPSAYLDMPPSPTMEALPSAEGSVIGLQDSSEDNGQQQTRDLDLQQTESQKEVGTPTQEKSFFDNFGSGFAGVVGAAAAAAVTGGKKPAQTGDKEPAKPAAEITPTTTAQFGGFGDIVDAAVFKKVSHGKGPVDEELGEPGTAVEEQPSQLESSKELAPETTGPASEPAQPQTEEPLVEEVATTSSSKKKKKKKGKKGQNQSVDETPSEPAPLSEEQGLAVEATEGEARSIESEAAHATVEQDTTVQPEPEAEQALVSKEVEAETLPAEAAESTEAITTSEPEASAALAELEPVEPVTIRESQPEPATSENVSTEFEAPMTAAEKRKAKKAAKKKAKSISSADEIGSAAQPSYPAVPFEETQVQEEKGMPQDVSLPEAPKSEQGDSEFHDSRETAETVEPAPSEYVSKELEEAALEAQDIDLPQSAPTEPVEEPQTVEQIFETSEEVTPTPASDDTPAEKTGEADEDNFQEAVEEQAEQAKELPSEAAGGITETTIPVEPQQTEPVALAEPEPEVPMTAAQKKKAKKDKKKNRKSVSFDEAETSTEPNSAADPEPEETKDLEPEQSTSSEPVDTQVPLADGETQSSGPELVAKDASELPTEEAVTAQEPEFVPSGDVEPSTTIEPAEPTEPTEPIEPTEEMPEPPLAEPERAPEAEPEFPMTAAQKKKAKKDKKKKKANQSISSITDDEKPAEPESADSQPEAEPALEATAAPDATPEIASAADGIAADVASLKETKELPVDSEQPQEEPIASPTADASEEAPVQDAVAEPSEVQPEAPREMPMEEVPAEPEFPMTAAEKRKAKKAAKKKQQQQGSLSSIADETPAAETTSAPEAEVIDTTKDIEAAPEAEIPVVEEVPAPATETEAVEPASDVPAPADAPQEEEEEAEAESFQTEQPKEEDSTLAAAVETVPEIVEPEPSREELEAASPTPDAPMTAAEKKKTKKAKKKQQRQSVDFEDQTVSTEQQDTENTEDPLPETEAAVPEPTTTEAESDSKAEAKPGDVEGQAAADVEKDATAELSTEDAPNTSEPSPETTADVQTVTEEAVAEAAPVDTLAETTQEKNKDVSAEGQPTSDQLLGDKAVESTPEQPTDERAISEEAAPDTTAIEETATPVSADDAPTEEIEVPMTAAQKKKAKKDKKKRQSLALAEESQLEPQPEPVKEEPVEPAESAEPASAEGASAEAVETTPSTENVEASVSVEEPAPEEVTKDEPMLENQVAESDAPVEPEPEQEVPMSAAQKKKAKKEKKKRQSMGLEESQPELQPEPTKEEEATGPTSEEPASTENAEAAAVEERVPDEITKDQPALDESPPKEPLAEEPFAEAEATTEPETEFEVPMTAAQKKKAKKEKKKRQSMGLEEPQPEPVIEEPADVAPSEPAETPASTGNIEAVDEAAPEATRDVAALDQPVFEFETPAEPGSPAEAGPEIPMTAAQKKKAKKDKKKRKSVAFEDEAQPEQEASTRAENVENQDQPTVDATSSQELTETLVDTEQPVESSTEKDIAEHETRVVDTTENVPGTEEPATPEAPVNAPEFEPAIQPDEKAESPEEPSQTAEDEETLDWASLSAKERRKLKKKENKKGKSVDLSEEVSSPSTEAPQETQEPDSEASTPERIDVSSPADKDIANAEEDQSPKTIDAEVSEEKNVGAESDPAETAEPEMTTKPKDDETPAAETAAELEPAPSKESEEPESEAGLSAKERRKLKKKEKKRQSRNLDVDDNPPETESAQDSPVPETAPIESSPAADEIEKSSLDKSDTWEITEPVTAPSPAENDGKEHQSHDIETPNTPAQDLASTDEFLSSQVEQPQLESPSSDYPPQPVLERSIDFGDAQKEKDAVGPIREEEVSIVKETPTGDIEGDLEHPGVSASKDATVEDTKVGDLGIMSVEESSLPNEEEDIQKEPQHEAPGSSTEAEVDAPASTEQEPSTEEASETIVSQKQRKKDKKKKQKLQEEEEVKIEEDVPVPEEAPATTETEQPEYDLPIPEETETKELPEPEVAPTEELETAPLTEESPAKQAEDVASPTPQPSEWAESSKNVNPIEDEPATEEQLEEAPLSRKLSKKEKKKHRQALLAQENVEEAAEDQPAPEPTKASDPVSELAEEAAAPADDQKDDKSSDVFDKTTVRAPDAVEDASKDVVPTASQEVEQAEPALERATEETGQAPVYTEETPTETSVEPQEWPTVTRKMSKKEKKKAAAVAAAATAAAAAAAIEEEKPVELEPNLDKPPVSEQVPETSKDEGLAEDSLQTGPDPSAEVIGKPTEIAEPQTDILGQGLTSNDVVEESAPVEPISRKLSKKEKRKAKKQGKEEPADSAAETEQSEAVPSTELTDTEESREVVPEPEFATQDALVDAHRELGSESIEEPSALKPEQSTHETEVPRPEETNDEAVVSLDPFDALSPTELPDQGTEGTLGGNPSSERGQEQEQEIEAKLWRQALEKEADLEAAGDLFEDRPREPEKNAPLSKKLSKKEKRKAKRGIVEAPLDQEEEPAREPISEEPKNVKLPPPALEPEVEPETIAEPKAPVEAQPEPELELSKDIDLTSTEPQSVAEQITEPEVTAPGSVLEELETPLSRKASKKNAKRAKKAAALALDEEPTAEIATGDQGAVLLEPEEPVKALQADLPQPTMRELNQDEDEWPSIEWEQSKLEKAEPVQEQFPEAEPITSVPDAETIGEFDEFAIPAALQEAKKEAEEPFEEESWSMPLSKKDKKNAKKNKRKAEQATLVEESTEERPHKMIELASDAKPEPMVEAPASKEIETEPPSRSTTPGGSKIATLFPGLERGGFRRTAMKKDAPSVKDSAEEETAADLEANRDIAIPAVLEALPLATTEARAIAHTSFELPTAKEAASTTTRQESTAEPELPVYGKRSVADEFPSPEHPASKERSSMLFGSSPSTRTEEASSPRHLLPSQMEDAHDSPSGLRRSPSVIHGKHQHTPRTWNLEDQSMQAVSNPSPPRSLFGPFEHDSLSRPRTPLDTIAEQEPGDGQKTTTARSGTPRLEIKPEHVLPRPVTPVRKFTDNALERKAWPTPENASGSGSSQDNLSKISKSPLQTPELGAPVLKPSSSKGKLRRTNRSTSSDLRATSRGLDSPQPPSDLDQLPSSSSYDPVTDKGKRPVRNMSDVYEGWGETPSSPRSPSRPPSVRRRRSMQHLQDLEGRLDQLISENRLLIAARDEAEDRLRNASVGRRKSDRALKSSGADLRDREAEVEQLKNSVEWFQKEMGRLTQENEGLAASNAALAAAHAAEVSRVRETSTRELDTLRSQHDDLSSNMDDRVRQQIEAALAQKDAELRRLREELEEARDKVKELQQQIAASLTDNALVFRDEDYFDAACQKLCGHVQQWVLRFSKHSDHRRCRALSELQDEKIADRFDNALLDGSDADAYLADRVCRRDVFMSVVMTMVWEYIFTRYLFGMDREQRQKLKSLEKQLAEVGPRRAVHRWRATTLTLLSNRPAFASQRDSDTEAVALEIFGTLSRVLPPPSQKESQLLDSLRKVLRLAVKLSLEMRTQLAEFIMLPPLQPEYDTNGDLARQVYFNASLMNERSGETSSNDELESQQAVVRIVLFPLVVKKGNDVGEGDEEVVVCPAQVLVARPSKDKRLSRMMSGDRMSIDGARSVHSVAPSIAPSTMDMSNVI